MRAIKKILIPTDFSPAANHAVDEGIELARLLGATVTLLNIYQLPPAIGEAGLSYDRELLEGLETAAREQLDETSAALRDRVPDCPPLSTRAVLGVPHEQIAQEARDGHYDLIVMSTHGRTGVRHFLLGSVAERVVRFSSVPVLTIHPGLEPEARRQPVADAHSPNG